MSMDINGIMKLLPHRYPFLMVDRIVEYVPDSHLTAYKNVTVNEPFFQGHFPGLPVMPGVLITEALAQTGGLYVAQTLGGSLEDKVFLFTGIEKMKFRKPVVPGDQLMLTVDDIRQKLGMWKMHGVATVDGKKVAEGICTAAVADKETM